MTRISQQEGSFPPADLVCWFVSTALAVCWLDALTLTQATILSLCFHPPSWASSKHSITTLNCLFEMKVLSLLSRHSVSRAFIVKWTCNVLLSASFFKQRGSTSWICCQPETRGRPRQTCCARWGPDGWRCQPRKTSAHAGRGGGSPCTHTIQNPVFQHARTHAGHDCWPGRLSEGKRNVECASLATVHLTLQTSCVLPVCARVSLFIWQESFIYMQWSCFWNIFYIPFGAVTNKRFSNTVWS